MTTPSTIGHVRACQICAASSLELVLMLGHHPLPSSYLTEAQLHDPETAYPLTLVRCTACGLVQLDHIVDPTSVFPPEYPYQTGMTNMLIRNFQALADAVVPAYGLTSEHLVVDIGSNDGTLLKPFKAHGVRVLGVEPTDTAKLANAAGIETIQAYLTVETARAAAEKYGTARVVTAANVFAHIPNPVQVVEGVKALLSDDGVFISESQYLMDIVEHLEFDTVYHEHLRFYALKPLQTLFALTGMSIVDAERISAAGGSIRVYAKKGTHVPSARVAELIAAEEAAGLYDAAALNAFAQKAIQAKRDLLALLLSCRAKGRIAALGSPVRANTLMGFTRLDTTLIDYCGERSGSPKIGLYTPGTHIPVADEKRLFDEQPEFLLVNSWHIGEELMKKMRDLGYNGTFIVPLPTPRLVS
ncbi:MAG: hypothetical protein RL141_1026 [Candidatus Parcubacteria bacterium]|jgi:2-polyprenyl-3-methyl-5-hydroxy-6-metoxy-1,4-benzoquinol methylase